MSKILLIESDRLVAANTRGFLAAAGHQTDWQVELQAALDSLDSFKPDLIILDLLLAGRSGAEFLYELRSYPDWEKLPVIIFSGAGGLAQQLPERSLEHLNIGAFHYKSVDNLSELTASIDRLLQPAKA